MSDEEQEGSLDFWDFVGEIQESRQLPTIDPEQERLYLGEKGPVSRTKPGDPKSSSPNSPSPKAISPPRSGNNSANNSLKQLSLRSMYEDQGVNNFNGKQLSVAMYDEQGLSSLTNSASNSLKQLSLRTITEDQGLSNLQEDEIEFLKRKREIREHSSDDQVSVTNPLKHKDSMSPYVSYLVTITAADGCDYVRSRRYNDFLWLHKHLKEEFRDDSTVTIPVPPEKQILNRFSSEFIEARRKELEMFLQKCFSDRVIRKSLSLAQFLAVEFDPVDNKRVTRLELSERRNHMRATSFEQRQRSPPSESKETSEKGHGTRSPIKETMSTFKKKLPALPTAQPKKDNEWITSQHNYLYDVEQQLRTLSDKTSKVISQSQSQSQALNEMANAASGMSASEIGRDDSMAEMWEKLAFVLRRQSVFAENSSEEIYSFKSCMKGHSKIAKATNESLEDAAGIPKKSRVIRQKSEVKSDPELANTLLNDFNEKHSKRSSELRESVKQLADFHVAEFEKQLLFWKTFQQYLNQKPAISPTRQEGDGEYNSDEEYDNNE